VSPATSTTVAFAHGYNGDNQRTSQSASDNSWLAYPPATASTISYNVNALNQYTTAGSVTPTYDANGNLIYDGSFTYGYDAENRLTLVQQGAATVASYAYDAQGRRKLKTVGTATTVFVTDADNREVLEYDGTSGQIQRWYAYGIGANDVLNQMNVAAATRTTFIPDLQGSVVATLDSGSGTLSKTGYLPYGESASAAGTFRYSGQRIDPETNGLYYDRARMYAPTLGRFMQPDPIGYAGGSNLYAYVGNDPLNDTDPYGECPWCVGALIGAGIDVGTQLTINLASGQSLGQSFRNIELAEVGISAALGAVGNIAGGRAASLGLRAARNGTKEIIGEIGATVKGLGQGRVVVKRQIEQNLSQSFTRVDQMQRSLFTGEDTLVEAKFSTSGRPSLTGPQRRALTELPAQGIDYQVITTTADEVIGVGRVGGAAVGGAIGAGAGAYEHSAGK